MGVTSSGGAIDKPINKTTKSSSSEEDFTWDNLSWVDTHIDQINTNFVKCFGDELKEKKHDVWKDKLWYIFLVRVLENKKRKWVRNRLRMANLDPSCVVNEKDNAKQVRNKEELKLSKLVQPYKPEYENMVRNLLSILDPADTNEKKNKFFEQFVKCVQIFTDKAKLYEEYFTWPESISLEHVQNNTLPLHFQWIADSSRLAGKSDEEILKKLKVKEESFGRGLVVRIIVSSLRGVDKSSLMGGIRIWFASKWTSLGLNHTSLQVGPYFIHWTDSSLVTFHDVGEHQNAFALFYPDPQFLMHIDKDKDKFLKLCEVIVKFNHTTYSMNNHCQNFVNSALDTIGCYKKYSNDGPIEKFLSLAAKLESNSKNISFYDPEGKQISFTNYQEFRDYCVTSTKIKALLGNKDYYNSNLIGEKDIHIAEFLQVLKAVERGFQIQLPNQTKTASDDLLFPIQIFEKVGSVTALPNITIGLV